MPVVTLAREQTATAGPLQKAGFKWHLKIYGKALHYSGLAKNLPFKDFSVSLLVHN